MSLSEDIDLKDLVRTIPDYPKPGIMFRDITTLLGHANGMRACIERLVAPFTNRRIESVAGIEARGFILGGAVADRLRCGFVPIRKKGKLPAKAIGQEYELEYGTAALEVPAETDVAGKNVVLVDDVLATGGTLVAARNLLEKIGANVIGNVVVLEVEGLGGREKLAGAPLVVVSHQDS